MYILQIKGAHGFFQVTRPIEERCTYLESKGLLYEDGIKYGTQWWYHKIPEDDLKTIVELLTENND